METSLEIFNENNWLKYKTSHTADDKDAQLVLCFGDKKVLNQPGIYDKIRQKFNNGQIVIFSTAGEILQNNVNTTGSLLALSISFKSTLIQTASISINDFSNSFESGVRLMEKLPKENLRYVLIISDGTKVNGSELVKGIRNIIGNSILVTGGLAGDSNNFKSTLVGLNEQPKEGRVVAIGFYGDNIFVTCGTQGGWEAFGPKKKVTKSSGNVLYEIDGKKVLDIYKKYLGDDASLLPFAALRYPLAVYSEGNQKAVVRTILSIDETYKSMTFAGDIPEGAEVKFMKSDTQKLISAVYSAANSAIKKLAYKPNLAILISCVGRKLILGNRLLEEADTVDQLLDDNCLITGFYAYGEIAPFDDENEIQLHNQTLTITTFYEAE